jgi:hypothetical protein
MPDIEELAKLLRPKLTEPPSAPSASSTLQSPSKVNDSNAKPLLLKALQYAQGAGFAVSFNGKPANMNELSASGVGNAVSGISEDARGAWDACGLPHKPPELSPEAAELGEVLAGCVGAEKEDSVQIALRAWLGRHRGVDTSSSQKQWPSFLFKEKLSKVNDQEADAFRATGKADGQALAVPLSLEIKRQDSTKTSVTTPTDQDIHVLRQSLERVVPLLQMSGYLSKAVSIGSTGRCSWVVVARRDPSCSDNQGTVTIHRFPTAHAGSLWLDLCNQGLVFFLTKDGPRVVMALRGAGLQPATCRVRFEAKSSARVYKVTPATKFWTPSSNRATCLGVVGRGDEVLAIKVVDDTSEFTNECQVLKLLSSMHKNFYGLGCTEGKSSVMWFKDSIDFASTPCFEEMPSAWWSFAPELFAPEDSNAVDGGCILMRCADRHLSTTWSTDWCAAVEGAVLGLHAAHLLKWCHCDLRAGNLLHFSDGWQLADWGLACPTNSTIKISSQTSQGRRTGCRVRELLQTSSSGQVDTSWTAQDDWEMLALMPYDKWARNLVPPSSDSTDNFSHPSKNHEQTHTLHPVLAPPPTYDKRPCPTPGENDPHATRSHPLKHVRLHFGPTALPGTSPGTKANDS